MINSNGALWDIEHFTTISCMICSNNIISCICLNFLMKILIIGDIWIQFLKQYNTLCDANKHSIVCRLHLMLILIMNVHQPVPTCQSKQLRKNLCVLLLILVSLNVLSYYYFKRYWWLSVQLFFKLNRYT